MSHVIHGRLVCDAVDEADAMAVFNRVSDALGLACEITVSEPFGENPALYDIVFAAPLPAPGPADLIGYFEGLLARIGGDWQEKQLAYYQGQRYQCSAVLDRYEAPEDGIAWMSLELQPAG